MNDMNLEITDEELDELDLGLRLVMNRWINDLAKKYRQDLRKHSVLVQNADHVLTDILAELILNGDDDIESATDALWELYHVRKDMRDDSRRPILTVVDT